MQREASLLSSKKDVIGGLAGEITTAQIPKARKAYLDYLIDFSGTDDDKLNFADFVRKNWKKEN